MGKNKVLVKISPEGKFVVNLDKNIKIEDCIVNTRVALKSDSYILHKILPTKVDPLVSLMKVEKIPDSTYDMVHLYTILKANLCSLYQIGGLE